MYEIGITSKLKTLLAYNTFLIEFAAEVRMRPDYIKITASIDQYLPVVLLAILYRIVLISATVDEIIQVETILIAFVYSSGMQFEKIV